MVLDNTQALLVLTAAVLQFAANVCHALLTPDICDDLGWC